MITFSPVGRAGNFLFEAACCIAYALKHGIEFSIPSTTSNEKWSPLYLQHLVNANFNPNLPKIVIKEATHGYEELPFYEEWRSKNIYIGGYRQSQKYFIEYREDILKLFNFHWHLDEGWVSLHRRYGDYVRYADRFHNITDEYIKNALNYFGEIGFTKIKVFSDGMEEARVTINSKIYPDFEFQYQNGNEIEDLISGSCCQNHIIAASTFSWWQSWLGKNEDKITVAPVKWFEALNSHLETKNIIPENWIKL